jgi:hypothetical protein
MNDSLIQLFFQFFPVFIGAAAMYILMRVNLSKDNIRIYIDKTYKRKTNGSIMLYSNQFSAADANSKFLDNAYDELIINGKFVSRSNPDKIKELAWKFFGMAQINEIYMNPNKFNSLHFSGSMHLITNDYPEFICKLSRFNEVSGVILNYLSEYSVIQSGFA